MMILNKDSIRGGVRFWIGIKRRHDIQLDRQNWGGGWSKRVLNNVMENSNCSSFIAVHLQKVFCPLHYGLPFPFFLKSTFSVGLLWLTCHPSKTNAGRATPAVPCFPVWPPFQVGYLWFPSIVSSSQCQTIFTLDEPNQSLFACQQQLPWQHTGRSTL